MWGKRPTSKKGLRCGVTLAAKDKRPLATCDRPARRYEITDYFGNTGAFCICKQHVQMYVNEGCKLTLIDRRKTHSKEQI